MPMVLFRATIESNTKTPWKRLNPNVQRSNVVRSIFASTFGCQICTPRSASRTIAPEIRRAPAVSPTIPFHKRPSAGSPSRRKTTGAAAVPVTVKSPPTSISTLGASWTSVPASIRSSVPSDTVTRSDS